MFAHLSGSTAIGRHAAPSGYTGSVPLAPSTAGEAPDAPALSRRSFLVGALTTAALITGAGILGASQIAHADEAAESSAGDKLKPAYDADATGAVSGGTLRWYITNPGAIEPFGAEENQGIEICSNLFETLTRYDYANNRVVPQACESYEVNDDATQFTFHLRKEATFHNGQPVTSKDYKYAWERICRNDFKPSPSAVGYKIEQVKGASEMMAGTASELAVECPDDYTLVVNLAYPFAEFDAVVADVISAPVPAGCTDTEEDFQKFRVAPIGNGPFMMDGEWVDGQHVNVKRYDGYWGDKPYLDGVNFQVFSDDQTAWMEYMAGNLDYTVIPSGQFDASIAQYGEARDGYVANPGEQVFTGDENSTYYLLCNLSDDVAGDKDVRIGISCAINRKAICDTVMQGTRTPADNMLTPIMPGYEVGGWDFCPAEGDTKLAAEHFDAAGYPADADGKRALSITLACNPGSSNEDILSMVQADLAQVGVDAQIETQEWAAYLDGLQSGNFQFGRLGWVGFIPSPYYVFNDLFRTGTGGNWSFYSNSEFDETFLAASQILDADERTAAYQKANAILAEDFPVIPLLFYRHSCVASARAHNLFFGPDNVAILTKTWLEG